MGLVDVLNCLKLIRCGRSFLVGGTEEAKLCLSWLLPCWFIVCDVNKIQSYLVFQKYIKYLLSIP